MVLLPVSRSKDVARSKRKTPTQPSSGDVETVSAAVARDPGLRVPSGAFDSVVGQVATAFAPEVERMAKIAFKKDQDAADMRDKADLNNAKIEATRRTLELKKSFENDTNYRTQGDRAQMGFGNIRNEVGGSLPEHLQTDFNIFYDQKALTSEFDVRDSAGKSEIVQNQAKVVDDMEFLGEAMVEAKTDEERDELRDQMIALADDSITSGLLPPDGKGSGKELLETTLRRVDKLMLDNAIKADPAAAKEALEGGAFHFLEPEDVDKAEGTIKTALKKVEDEKKAQVKDVEEKNMLDVQQEILEKEMSGETLDDFVASVETSVGQKNYVSLLKQAQTINSKVEKKEVSDAEIKDIVDNAGFLNPKVKAHKEYAQEQYDRTDKSIESLVQVSSQTSIVPKEALLNMTNGFSRDVEFALQMADKVDALREKSLTLYAQLPKSTKSKLIELRNLVEGGFDPKEAFEDIKESATRTKQENDVIKAQYKEALPTKTEIKETNAVSNETYLNDKINEDFGVSFLDNALANLKTWHVVEPEGKSSENIEASANVQARFDRNVRAHYNAMAKPDLDTARQLAYDDTVTTTEIDKSIPKAPALRARTSDIVESSKRDFTQKTANLSAEEMHTEAVRIEKQSTPLLEKYKQIEADFKAGKKVDPEEFRKVSEQIQALQGQAEVLSGYNMPETGFVDNLDFSSWRKGGIAGITRWFFRRHGEKLDDEMFANEREMLEGQLFIAGTEEEEQRINSAIAQLDNDWEKMVIERYVDARRLMENAEAEDFDVGALWDAAIADPGGMAAQMINFMIADPEYLLMPIGALRGAAMGAVLTAKMSKAATRMATISAGLSSASAVGFVTELPISAARQLSEGDIVNPARTIQEAQFVAVAAPVFVAGLFTVTKALPRLAQKAGKTETEFKDGVTTKIDEGLAEGKTLKESTTNAYKVMGIEEDLPAALKVIDDIKADDPILDLLRATDDDFFKQKKPIKKPGTIDFVLKDEFKVGPFLQDKIRTGKGIRGDKDPNAIDFTKEFDTGGLKLESEKAAAAREGEAGFQPKEGGKPDPTTSKGVREADTNMIEFVKDIDIEGFKLETKTQESFRLATERNQRLAADATDEALDILRDPGSKQAKQVKKPQRLSAFIKKKGGMKITDEMAEFTDRSISSKSLPGLFNKSSKQSVENMMEAAREEGFFTGKTPTFDEFIDALAKDLNEGSGPVKAAEVDLADFQRGLDDLFDEVNRAGLDLSKMSNAEIKAALEVLSDAQSVWKDGMIFSRESEQLIDGVKTKVREDVRLTEGNVIDQWENMKIIEYHDRAPGGEIIKGNTIELEGTTTAKGKTTRNNKQSGNVDPKLAGAMAVMGIGALVGGKEDGVQGAVETAAILGVGLAVGARGVSILKAMNPKVKARLGKAITFDHLFQKRRGDIQVAQRHNWIFSEAIKEAVPDPLRREQISHFLDGTEVKLSTKEREVAVQIREYLDTVFKLGEKEGVLTSYLENYIPHVVKLGTGDIADAVAKASSKTNLTSTKFNRQRSKPGITIKELEDAGFEMVTKDPAELARIYGNAVHQTVSNKRLVQSLLGQTLSDGTNVLVKSADEAPSNYVVVDHPSLTSKVVIDSKKVGKNTETTFADQPMRVHPDLAQPLKMVFESFDPDMWYRSLLSLNYMSKRMLVSMSAFHANALVESAIFAGKPNIARNMRYADLLRTGKPGDVVDEALRSGLTLGTIDDVGTDAFYGAIDTARKTVDRLDPLTRLAVGQPLKVFEGLSRRIDNIMWDKIATGSKLMIYADESAKAMNNPANKNIPPEVLQRQVAQSVNDMFGGQDWAGLAEAFETRFMRDLAFGRVKQSGRAFNQLLLFAPDWTISNIRVLGKAIPGIAKNPEISKLHQYYALRGAIFFGIAGSAVNIHYVGKPIWENKDPTMIDMGDGRRMTFSKQFVEPFHWADKPWKTLVNKGGIIPKELFSLGTNREYISPNGSPKIWDDDDRFSTKLLKGAGHTAQNFEPIFMQQLHENSIEAGAAGFAGHPIYGTKR